MGIIVCLIGLINIASTTAFNAIRSLATLGLYLSYFIPIVILALRKLQDQPISYGPFRLGQAGLYINIFVIVYGVSYAASLLSSRAAGDKNQYELLKPGIFLRPTLQSLRLVYAGEKTYTGPIRELAQEEFR